jgi:DivIVA domain-containing protein
MADSHTSDNSTQRFQRGPSTSERLRDVTFPLAVRGYDRRAVDDFVDEVRAVVADLEGRQTREGVVQKALDELGEETAGILQRAHETADEITARSRAKADGRLQRAEREAEIVKRDADQYSEQVVVDTRLLWEERQRLIDDIRQLADDVLATADDAIERLKLPDPLAAAEGQPTPPEGAPTVLPGGEAEPFGAAEPDPLPFEPVDRNSDPDPTAPYRIGEAPDEEDPDPDATAPFDVEAGPGEDDVEEPAQQEPEQPGDDDSGHTVELEALPGGADEQPGEREREPE